jgi:hypothetical protein
MKSLFRILFVLALICGFAPHAKAADFHVQVLDPNICLADSSVCLVLDPSAPINVSLNATVCQIAGVPNLPSNPNTYGCAVLFNLELPPQDITELTLSFSGLDGLTFECDTTGVGNVGSIFSNSSCGQIAPGSDTFSFFNGSLPFLGEAIIYENGVDPNLFIDGKAVANVAPFVATQTPEPASLLLLSTGVMLAGLYCVNQRRQLAFAIARK